MPALPKIALLSSTDRSPGADESPSAGPTGAVVRGDEMARTGTAATAPADAAFAFAYRPVGDGSNGVVVTARGLATLFGAGRLDPRAYECRQLGAEAWISPDFLRPLAGPSGVAAPAPVFEVETWLDWICPVAWGLGTGAVLAVLLMALLETTAP